MPSSQWNSGYSFKLTRFRRVLETEVEANRAQTASGRALQLSGANQMQHVHLKFPRLSLSNRIGELIYLGQSADVNVDSGTDIDVAFDYGIQWHDRVGCFGFHGRLPTRYFQTFRQRRLNARRRLGAGFFEVEQTAFDVHFRWNRRTWSARFKPSTTLNRSAPSVRLMVIRPRFIRQLDSCRRFQNLLIGLDLRSTANRSWFVGLV